MNKKFLLRSLLIALPTAAIATVVGLNLIVAQTPTGQPPDPTPPPPTILAPPGEMPSGSVGLEEWVRHQGGTYSLAGTGFLIALEDGTIVGVTTAHSVSVGDPNNPLERIGLATSGSADTVVESDTLYGTPGHPSTEDLSQDYVLFQVDSPVDPELVLAPDTRSEPQPGERVIVYGGVRDEQGQPRVLSGTVQAVSETAVWVLMDQETFNPSLMSGSPCVSQHTGQVVGMAIVAMPRQLRLFPRRYRVLLGLHPIGSILQLAESADTFPKMSEFRR